MIDRRLIAALTASIIILGACAVQQDISDDFSTQSGWSVFDHDAGFVGYTYDHFQITVNQPDTFLWSQAGGFFRNVLLEVDAAQVDGLADNYFGLLCRIQESGAFYAGLISSDGFFSIQRRDENGQMVLLGSDIWGIDEALSQGAALKNIQMECSRDLVRLFANGKELTVIRDTTLTGGDVGLIAGTLDSPSLDILFDDFSAVELSE